jgi:hypothetical protein
MIIPTRNTLFINATKKLIFSFCKAANNYEVIDIKNSHLIYVKDPKATLPYLSQIRTTSGQQGIVIKL